MVELVILLFVVLAVACFGLLLPFLLERAGRHGGFPARGSASGLLAACPSDGSHDFYLSMMLDVPVPRVPMLRARLQDSRRGGAA